MADICIGTVAKTLSVGGHVMSNIVLGACIIVGISLIAMAGVHYKGHKHNPKLVPLSKPILYLSLGFVLLAIPFLEHFIAPTGRTAAKYIHEKTHSVYCDDIDAPIN